MSTWGKWRNDEIHEEKGNDEIFEEINKKTAKDLDGPSNPGIIPSRFIENKKVMSTWGKRGNDEHLGEMGER